jgi:hypothetical protein
VVLFTAVFDLILDLQLEPLGTLGEKRRMGKGISWWVDVYLYHIYTIFYAFF